jgi:hypothetical protein
MREALGRFEKGIVEQGESATTPPRFIGYTADEVADHFRRQRRELEFQASLLLFTAAEGVLQADWPSRRDDLGRALQKEARRRPTGRLEMEADLLEAWESHAPELKKYIGPFKGALRFRHWLAHGRYWTPKLGEHYDPETVFRLAKDMFARMEGVEGWD